MNYTTGGFCASCLNPKTDCICSIDSFKKAIKRHPKDILKEAEEKGLSREETKELLIKEGIIVKKNVQK
jgi:hypothetical protein